MGRIETAFQQLKAAGHTGLIAYVTVGFPTLAETADLVRAAVEGGATIIELGVPFSDPLADGATHQRAMGVALEQGVSMRHCLEVAAALRQDGLTAPLLLMGYYNTWLSYGLERWCTDAAAAGVDGAIVVDLPPEEAAKLEEHAHAKGLDLVFLLAPTSTDDRMEEVGKHAGGFVYCVSVTGVTGARTALPPDLSDFVNRVRKHIRIPIAVGFGVSQREHVLAISKVADAVVVGSALVDVVEQSDANGRAEKLRAYVHELVG